MRIKDINLCGKPFWEKKPWVEEKNFIMNERSYMIDLNKEKPKYIKRMKILDHFRYE